jgi:elongation factor Ts
MSQVTAQMVKELRDRTGVGMGKCKEALTESSGDIEAAIDILRKAGAASAVKKGGRETNEGLIGIAEDANGVAIVEVNAETDFVVKNDRFQAFVNTLAEAVRDTKVKSLEAFLAEKNPANPSMSIEESRVELVQVLGENIQVRRIKYKAKKQDASYGIYSHMGGRIVVSVEIAGAKGYESVARDVAMHCAAEAPDFLTADEIPADVKEREIEIAKSQIQNKPANIQEKIIQGKLKAFADQVCLTGQKFVKDTSVTVAQYVEQSGKEKGAKLTISGFLRWEVGSA